MSLAIAAAPLRASVPCRALVTRDPDELARITAPDVNVVVWRRPSGTPEVDVQASGEAWSTSVDLDLRRAPEARLAELAAPLPEVSRAALVADLTELAARFGEVADRFHVHAQLSLVTHDMCRKLHSDNVPLRLLCTYAGPATEWVADRDVVRENLARVDVDVETANRSVLRRPNAVRHAGVGDVVLLKGDAWPGFRRRGAVHRSPPIESTGARRVLFKLDVEQCGC